MGKAEIFRFIKAKSPLILSCFAAVGVISTAVLAVKATPKAIKRVEKMREPITVYYDNKPATITPSVPTKKDIFKAVWKDYIPAAAMGVGTIVCIFAASILNKRNQVMLTSSYAVLNKQFKRYSEEVVERFGKETHEDILDTIRIEKPENIVIKAPGLFGDSSISFDSCDENKVLFYDMMSKRYFNSTIGSVMTAIHHLNRNFCMGADPEVNMFYDFLGLESVENGDGIGWSPEDGIYWIDFEIFKSKMDDDTLECYVINPIFWPEPFPTY